MVTMASGVDPEADLLFQVRVFSAQVVFALP